MQKIRIDFDNPGLPQHISAVENDSQSRFFQATLYENGKAYTAPEGATYSIMYRGFGPQNQGWYDTINDGAGKRAACIASGNVVTCEIARQALQVPGHVSIVLCVTTGKGYMLKSWPIECDCKNDRYDSTAEIQSFFYITQVSNADWNRAIQALEELKNTIDPTLSLSGKAADAAKVGEAVGQLKEDKVDNSDVTYNLSAMLEPFTQKQEITGIWDDNYTGYVDKLNGNAISFDQMRMISLQVKEHEIYDIKSRVGYRMALWSIHDDAGNVIKMWNNSDVTLPFDYYEDIGVVIPKNGVELRVYAYVGHLSSYIRKYIAKFHVDSPLKRKKWCAIGDSLTDSATLNGGKNYVDFISDESDVISINKGIGGTGYLNNNGGADTTFYERRFDFPKDADIYTFFGSFNDMNLFDDDSIGNIDSSDTTTLMGAMSLAIRAIGYLNPNAVVGVILPTPWASYNSTSISKSIKPEKYIKALIAICNKYSIPYLDLYHQSGLRPWDTNFNKNYYKDDNGDGNYSEGIHPNSLGHEKFIAPKVKLFLESLIN